MHMKQSGVCDCGIDKYVYCALLVNDIIDRIADRESLMYIIMDMYRILSGGIFPNLKRGEIRRCFYLFIKMTMMSNGLSSSYVIPKPLAPMWQAAWNRLHTCGGLGLCVCKWTEKRLIEGIEDVLMSEHNSKISGMSIAREENYDSLECMTTWLPEELMEDTVLLSGGISGKTRLVRV